MDADCVKLHRNISETNKRNHRSVTYVSNLQEDIAAFLLDTSFIKTDHKNILKM